VRAAVVIAVLGALAGTASAQLAAPTALEVGAPENDDGRHLAMSWAGPERGHYLVFRSATGGPFEESAGLVGLQLAIGDRFGDWQLVQIAVEETAFTDEVPGQGPYYYAVVQGEPGAGKGRYAAFSAPVLSAPAAPEASFFNDQRLFYLGLVVLMALTLAYYLPRARRRPESIYIRRIPGVDAIEEAVGRSTEMGRPILYVTGTEEIQNIQTIASLLILGHVAEMTAEYDTEIKVTNFFPLTMVVAEEIVKQGFASAGRIDAHKPENVMFISAEQFAFAAGVNGVILRDRPATNIYLGRFFAESLILAETGYITKAIQIAGTAEITQLPFFIAACDYTIIGEELYAVSAYLSREPVLLATLKATDLLKVIIIGIIVVGTAFATAEWFHLGETLIP
jgi:hypothetical protein